MLDNDNIISASVSEAVEKIPQIKKIIANAPLCVLLCTATAYKEQTNITKQQKQLSTYQDTSSVPKKITEDALYKIYTEKGAIIGILVLSTLEVRSLHIQVSWQPVS